MTSKCATPLPAGQPRLVAPQHPTHTHARGHCGTRRIAAIHQRLAAHANAAVVGRHAFYWVLRSPTACWRTIRRPARRGQRSLATRRRRHARQQSWSRVEGMSCHFTLARVSAGSERQRHNRWSRARLGRLLPEAKWNPYESLEEPSTTQGRPTSEGGGYEQATGGGCAPSAGSQANLLGRLRFSLPAACAHRDAAGQPRSYLAVGAQETCRNLRRCIVTPPTPR